MRTAVLSWSTATTALSPGSGMASSAAQTVNFQRRPALRYDRNSDASGKTAGKRTARETASRERSDSQGAAPKRTAEPGASHRRATSTAASRRAPARRTTHPGAADVKPESVGAALSGISGVDIGLFQELPGPHSPKLVRYSPTGDSQWATDWAVYPGFFKNSFATGGFQLAPGRPTVDRF